MEIGAGGFRQDYQDLQDWRRDDLLVPKGDCDLMVRMPRLPFGGARTCFRRLCAKDAMPSQKARRIASDICKSEKWYNGGRMKRLYILAGANGSGKSTISRVLLPTEGVVYVNPDDIARALNPANPPAAKIAAGKETLLRIDAQLNGGASFALESTLSGSGYVEIVGRAKSLGYEVTIAYVFVDSADFCLERIRVRVRNGGHDVPAEDVHRRYGRSKRNFVAVYAPLADHWMLYYNGGDDLLLVAHGNGDVRVVVQDRYDSFMEDVCLK